MDHTVAVAEATGQPLLLDVEHCHRVGQVERDVQADLHVGIGVHTHFRKKNPAHAIDVGDRQHAVHQRREHVPQPALECLRVDVLGHFVAADDALRIDHAVELCRDELAPRDVRQHQTIAPRKPQHALPFAFVLNQLRVLRERRHHLVRVLARLLQRIDDAARHAFGRHLEAQLAGLADVVELPVFDLQHQQAAARMQHDEVGVQPLGADRHVVPDEVVAAELLLEPFSKTPLARRHARHAGVQGRNQSGHERRSAGGVGEK